MTTGVTTGVFANHKQQSHACNSIGSTLDFFFFESTANRGRNLELVRETEVLPLWNSV